LRRAYLVCYDVADQKRWRALHTVMLGCGDPLQYSVFLCMLSERERVEMLSRIMDVIHADEDRVLIVCLAALGEGYRSALQFLGRPFTVPGRRQTVV
jgi:CRISPR-associated protein Cas2